MHSYVLRWDSLPLQHLDTWKRPTSLTLSRYEESREHGPSAGPWAFVSLAHLSLAKLWDVRQLGNTRQSAAACNSKSSIDMEAYD
jgi:hypothetical protein